MKQRAQYLVIPILIALLGVSILILTSGSLQAKTVAPVANAYAPEFVLKSLQNESVNLKDVYRSHKVTLLNFWATWCPPCRGEIPELNKIYDENTAKSVEILAVNMQENSGTLKEFVKANKMRFPILLDTDGKIGQLYRIYYIPTTFVIDSSGKIRNVIQGGTTYEVLKKAIDDLLKEG